MKTVLCYGDSNTWGAVPQPERGAGGRFPPDVRWPGVLRRQLGTDWTVVEEGLNGRTTCVDDPVEGRHKNGAGYLQVSLETHAPLDLVIVMLGTNDFKARLSMTAGDIADGAMLLGQMALNSACGPGGSAPSVLVVCPPPLSRLGWLAEMFEGGAVKSQQLASRMAATARRIGLDFLDAGQSIVSSEIDGIHLDEAAHARLGAAIAAAVLGSSRKPQCRGSD